MEAAKKIFCIGFALFKAIDKSMNEAQKSVLGDQNNQHFWV